MRGLAELVFPPKCVLCGQLLEAGEVDLCRSCRVNGPAWQDRREKLPFLDSRTSVWHYEGAARGSILRFKFHNKRHYAHSFARLLAMALTRQERTYDLVTWVPISFRRRLCRGYDQGQLLARAVGQELQIPVARCLKKVRHNRPQSGIQGDAQRRANVLGAYRAVEPARFAGKRVLLLDDVITTGATISECAKVLKIAGAGEVHGGSVAAANNKKSISR